MESDVKVLKLITGEELITRLTKKEKVYSLDKPMMLRTVPTSSGTGQIGFALVPWLVSGNNQTVEVECIHIIAEDDSRDQVSKNYLEAVTGLTL
jgi:hypothetical protein